jgi:hypothetical protein
VSQYFGDFFDGEDGWQAFRFICPQGVDGGERLVEYMSVEEDESAECLILRAGGDTAIDG